MPLRQTLPICKDAGTVGQLSTCIDCDGPRPPKAPTCTDAELLYFTAISVSIVSAGVVLAWGCLSRMNRSLRYTTLNVAQGWVLAAASLWTLTWTLDFCLGQLPKPIADHLWYAAAIVALCPPIAVLGARRPGTRVWNWFILVPMLFALGWPVMTLFVQRSDVRGLQLETPQLAAYMLVVVMGAGNYIGTRHTLAALLYVAANSCLVISSSAVCPAWLSDQWRARSVATGSMVLAILMASLAGGRLPADASRFDRLWLDFFDQFGVVWGRRIQDRVNFMATRESWKVRLGLHGFHGNEPPDEATERRIEHTFRWLLRRFVDPPWIDARLGTQRPESEVTPLGADS